MDLNTLESDLSGNIEHLRSDLAHDLKAEAAHIADPAQCGVIVRRHFDGIVIALYVFILLFLAAAATALYLYTRLHG